MKASKRALLGAGKSPLSLFFGGGGYCCVAWTNAAPGGQSGVRARRVREGRCVCVSVNGAAQTAGQVQAGRAVG